MYNGLIVGKMDQQNQTLEVESCKARDLKPGEDLDYIIQTLTNWRDSSRQRRSCLFPRGPPSSSSWRAPPFNY